MAQSEAAIEAYNSYWGGFVPASEIMWMVVILIICAIALWQARAFVHEF
ncbi:hypothetical protein V7O62_01885 [Methanolobus sp. ZRKC2]